MEQCQRAVLRDNCDFIGVGNLEEILNISFWNYLHSSVLSQLMEILFVFKINFGISFLFLKLIGFLASNSILYSVFSNEFVVLMVWPLHYRSGMLQNLCT